MLLRMQRAAIAVVLVATFLGNGVPASAGTTGTLNGNVTEARTNRVVAGARITVTSPSQSGTATTDAAGSFVFLALPPDTYTVAVERQGYERLATPGVTVLADQTRTIPLALQPALRVIGRVTARAATDLVKPGTTADVYSINALQGDKFSALGGGGNLNSAWSAITTVPGVFVMPGRSGYIGSAGGLSIRGGDYDQIGYEIDGVPVNRAFDNYPSGPVSSLGQQELQVYTGAAPPSAEAQGLSGFINQVIRSGTSPAFGIGTLGIGAPAFYHKAAVELGGATPSRNFSYYVGVGGYNQDFRYYDQFNGAAISNRWGVPLAVCDPSYPIALAPSCYTNGIYNGNTAALTANSPSFAAGANGGGQGSFLLGGVNLFSTSTVRTRDNVINLHFAILRRNGLRDDIQLLGIIDAMQTQLYTSTDDQGGAAFTNAVGATLGRPFFFDGLQYAGSAGVPLPSNYQALISRYFFPNVEPPGLGHFAAIPVDLRDGWLNDQAVFKLQWTHQLGDAALFRIYGYTYYSDWLNSGAQSAYANFAGIPADYELSSHARGLSFSFIDQINPKNLITLQGSYTTAATIRDNNSQMLNTLGSSRGYFAVLVDSTSPTNGLCYTAAGVATTCAYPGPKAAYATISKAFAGTIAPASGTCGGGPCEWFVVNNGQFATYNRVTPRFSSVSLTDQWRPNGKLNLEAGVRLDLYGYVGANTDTGPARTLFYNAFNLDMCVDPAFNLYDKVKSLGLASPASPCPAGYSPIAFTNPSGNPVNGYTIFQPRLAGTYSLSPATVLRFSFGRFTQAVNSAYQQYDTLQSNAPAALYSTYGFQKYGFTSPMHRVLPPTSTNFDVSLEHQFPLQLSLKVTPFLRKTQNQVQLIFLNPQTNFVSGLNVGRQTSQGVELEVDKGTFGREGFAAKLSFTYTNSYVNYSTLPNGASIIAPLNAAITAYNDFTSFCSKSPSDARCGSVAAAVTAAPCYTTAGAADFACAATSVANPYWNAPVQGLLDPNANYPTFSLVPGAIGTWVNAYGAPYVATLVTQWKHGKLAVTPALQFFAGQRYGAPESTWGIRPNACTAVLTSATAGDPRYPNGAAGGAPFDANSCGQLSGGIPDRYTGIFDGIGGLVAPSQLQLHLQVAYDFSPKVALVTTFANVLNKCFGGTKVGFNPGGNVCGYTVVGNGAGADIGNLYNPGAMIQPYLNTPYTPLFGGASGAPFNFYLDIRFRL